MGARRRTHFAWDGRTGAGAVAPDGVYHPWVAPRERAPHVPLHEPDRRRHEAAEGALGERREARALSPAPGRSIAIHYGFSEQAHALVYLGSRRSSAAARPGRATRSSGTAARTAGRFRAGTYVLSIGARDVAGNETPAAERKKVTVVVRYIEVTPRADHRATPASGSRCSVETAARRATRGGSAHRHGDAARERAAPARADDTRHVPARRDRARAHRRPRSCGCGQVIGLAEIAGPIACLGLAVLLARADAAEPDRRASATRRVGTRPARRLALAGEPAGARGGDRRASLVLGPLLAWLFRREPWLVAYATLAFVPFRVGFLGHQLLVPLYAVALGAAGLLLWQLVDGDERTRELGIASWPLALYLVWIGLSLEWSVDVHTAAIDLLAFYIPFTILALSIARLPWQPSRVRLLYGELVAMALVFAAVGFYQYETHTIFQNPKLGVSNTYTRSSGSTPSSTTLRSTGASSWSRSSRPSC